MNVLSQRFAPYLAALGLLVMAGSATAQDIYKCPRGNSVEYTDHPCAGAGGQLIHQADDSERIDYLLATGKPEAARQYASDHHLEGLYKDRMAAYTERQQQLADQTAADAQVLQQRKDRDAQQAEQQRTARLEAQNDLLREQNSQYRDALDQPAPASPAYGYAPGWGDLGYGRGYGNGHHRPGEGDHGHHGGPHEPGHGEHGGSHFIQHPVYHPCTQIAGGTVRC